LSNEARLYEAMYILDVSREEQEQEEAIAAVERTIAEGGAEVENTVVFGRRSLAYEINGRNEGLYMLTYFRGDGGAVTALQNEFAVIETILRGSIVVATPEAIYQEPEEVEEEAEESAEEAVAEAPEADADSETEAAEEPAEEETEEPAEEETEEPAEEETEEPAEEETEEPAEEETEEPAEEETEEAAAEEAEETPEAEQPE